MPAFFTIKINDYVSPVLDQFPGELATWLETQGDEVRGKIGENIKKRFYQNYNKWPELSPEWIARKASSPPFDIRKLRWHYPLLQEVYKLNPAMFHQIVDFTTGRYMLFFDKSFFASAPYVYYHEFGTKNMPQRDFIVDGLMDTKKDIEIMFGMPFEALKSELNYMTFRKSGRRRWQIIPEWVFWFLPLGFIFKWIGQYSDMMGMISGTIFKREVIEGFTRNMLLGKMGLTKKVIRRQFRQTIWK